MSYRNEPVDEVMPASELKNGVLLGESGQMMENELVLQFNDIQKQLMHSRSIVEAMESEQIRLIEELEHVQNENHRLRANLQNEKIRGTKYRPESQDSSAEENNLTSVTRDEDSTSKRVLQNKMNRLSGCPHPDDHALKMSCNHEFEMVQKEVEMETAKTILQLQEEITTLQSELQEKLRSMAEENASLQSTVAAKDEEIRQLSTEWERATLELTNFLTDGCKSLKDATSQVESITCLFPCVNVWISEHVEKAAKICIEKEENILLIKKSLEDAQRTVLEMDQKLNSLRGVTIALAESQQLEDGAKRTENLQVSTLPEHKFIMAKHLENQLMHKEDAKSSAEKCLLSTSFELKSFDQEVSVNNNEVGSKLTNPNGSEANVDFEMDLAHFGLLEVYNCIKTSCLNAEDYFSFLQSAIRDAFSIHKKLILDLKNEIRDIRGNFAQLKTDYVNLPINTVSSPVICSFEVLIENQNNVLYQVRDELAFVSNKLHSLKAFFCGDMCELAIAESLEEVDGWSTDSSTSTSSSKSSSVNIVSEKMSGITLTGYHNLDKKIAEQPSEQGLEEGATHPDYQESEESQAWDKIPNPSEATLLSVQRELRTACHAISKLFALLTGNTSDDYCRTLSVLHSPLLMNNEQNLIKNKDELVRMPERVNLVPNSQEMMQEDEFIKQVLSLYYTIFFFNLFLFLNVLIELCLHYPPPKK